MHIKNTMQDSAGCVCLFFLFLHIFNMNGYLNLKQIHLKNSQLITPSMPVSDRYKKRLTATVMSCKSD